MRPVSILQLHRPLNAPGWPRPGVCGNIPGQQGRQEQPKDAMTEDTRLPADIDAQPVVQAALALRPVLRSYQEEIEREQRLPSALVAQLHEAGCYRMVIPRALGGLQVDPLTYQRVVEVLAQGAGSVGWNVANN